MVYPKCLTNLIHSFEKLPGVGEKSAERYALSTLDLDPDEIDNFANNLLEIKANIKYCKICGHISDSEVCSICSDSSRDRNTICIVEDFKSVFKFENTNSYNGLYHVLGGLISPINNIFPDDINLDSLQKRIENSNSDIELIVALKPSVEGETTILYIKQMFQKFNIKISRLSYGIPMGVEIDYLDPLTIDRALNDRKDVE